MHVLFWLESIIMKLLLIFDIILIENYIIILHGDSLSTSIVPEFL